MKKAIALGLIALFMCSCFPSVVSADVKAPTNLNVTTEPNIQFIISWSATNGAEGYEVWRATSVNGVYKQICKTARTHFIDSDIGANSDFYYMVRAYHKHMLIIYHYSNFTAPVKGRWVSVTGVTLDRSTADVPTDGLQLTATVYPFDAADKRITWTSSNYQIAYVDGNGKITTISPGDAEITVCTAEYTINTTCKVFVCKKPANGDVTAYYDLDRNLGTISQFDGWEGTSAKIWESGHAYDQHDGTDFGVAEGTPVFPFKRGIVFTGVDDTKNTYKAGKMSRGVWVQITHEDGTLTLYGHLKPGSVLVRNGQVVDVNTQIASSGNTGYSTGPHLHFGLMINGQWVCPYYLKLIN